MSADTDFGTSSPRTGARSPSVVLLRLRAPGGPASWPTSCLANVDVIAEELSAGAIVVVEDERVRVRRLLI